ncbi:MAG: class I SAM-dependent methyltransferase [Chloroflexi bacterium]|nr:class I SAM-dependent methyltransferase [Chloroflexota bacterium]
MMPDQYRQSYQGRDRAQHWERNADLVIPRRQETFEVILDALNLPADSTPRLIDLGAGTGSLAEKAIRRWPGARIVCLDGSAEMIEIGREKMADFGDDVTWLKRDLADPAWATGIEGPFDGVASSFAIHMIPDEAKRRAYRWAFEALRPGARFVSADRLKAPTPVLDAEYHERWMAHIVRQTREILGKDVALDTVRERQRSMDDAANLKCITLEENLTLLREAGFSVVECFWKDWQRAVYGGLKF